MAGALREKFFMLCVHRDTMRKVMVDSLMKLHSADEWFYGNVNGYVSGYTVNINGHINGHVQALLVHI